DRNHLEPPGGNAERLRRVFVLPYPGQLIAESRTLQVDLDRIAQERRREGHVDPPHVAEPERREARPERYRDALAAGGEAPPAAHADQQALREGDGSK